MKKKRTRRLERRIRKLEAAVFQRDWSSLPEPVTIEGPDLPTLPDYTPGVILEDDEWNPANGYL